MSRNLNQITIRNMMSIQEEVGITRRQLIKVINLLSKWQQTPNQTKDCTCYQPWIDGCAPDCPVCGGEDGWEKGRCPWMEEE